jgi:predicted N-acyltransferase
MDIRYEQQAKIVTTSRDYLSDIYDTYNHNLKIFVVIMGDEIVTGAIRLNFRDTLYGWIGNPKPKNRLSPSPNHLLFWETVRYASEHEFKNYITMSAAGNKRLHEYYAARFNPELKIRYVATKKSFLAGISEKGYKNFLKPLRGRIKLLISEE